MVSKTYENFATILPENFSDIEKFVNFIERRNVEFMVLPDKVKSYMKSIEYIQQGELYTTRINFKEFIKAMTNKRSRMKYFILFEELIKHYPDYIFTYLSKRLRDVERVTFGTEYTRRAILYGFSDRFKVDIIRQASKYIDKLVKIEGIITISTDQPILDKTHLQVEHLSCGKTFEVIVGHYPIFLSVCPTCKLRLKPEDTRILPINEDSIIWYGVKDVKFDDRPTPYTILSMVKAKDFPYDIIKKLRLGTRVELEGILRKIRIIGKRDVVPFLEVTHIKIKDDIREVEVSEDVIDMLSKNPNLIVDSLAPEIQGELYSDIKYSLLLSIVSGHLNEEGTIFVKKGDKEYKLNIRPQIHVLLAGYPGTGKTKLLLSAINVSARARYINAIQASGVGLTVAVMKDPTGKTTLSGGAMVIADGGIVCIDELDKLGKEQTAYLNEAMEYNTITVSKAGITATLPANVSVIGAMNIKKEDTSPFGYEVIINSIKEKVREEVVDRFDLIFIINENDVKQYVVTKSAIDIKTIKSYLLYAKKKKVYITEDILDYITTKAREIYKMISEKISVEIESANRLRDKITRIAVAIAKLKNKQYVTKEDVDEAINLKISSYKTMGIDVVVTPTQIVVETANTLLVSSKKDKIRTIKNVIKDLQEIFKDGVPISEIVSAMQRYNVPENETRELIDALLKEGEIYEASNNKYKIIK